ISKELLIMHPIVYLLDTLLSIYNFSLVLWVILGWLIGLNIVNRYNEFVNNVFLFLSKVMFPAVNFVRKLFPFIVSYNFDLSPLILLVFINFVRYALRYYFG
ncbi:YGGT family protein, partial [Ehrlichia ruminantium]